MVPKTRSVFGIVATERERFARLVRSHDLGVLSFINNITKNTKYIKILRVRARRLNEEVPAMPPCCEKINGTPIQ